MTSRIMSSSVRISTTSSSLFTLLLTIIITVSSSAVGRSSMSSAGRTAFDRPRSVGTVTATSVPVVPNPISFTAAVGHRPATLNYRVDEDREAGTAVADLRRDAGIVDRFSGNQTVIGQLRFVFLQNAASSDSVREVAAAGSATTDNPYRHFHLDAVSGIIKTTTLLDRDRICPSAETCNLAVDVAVQPSIYFFIIKISFELVDKNDNPPRFPVERMQVTVSEGAPPGTMIPLRSASDPDSPPNGVTGFHLVDLGPANEACRKQYADRTQADASSFGLSVEKTADKSFDVRLVVNPAGLDRERCDTYRLEVVASDGGQPVKKSGTMTVEVTVSDVDDNRPEFDPPVYEAEIVEHSFPSSESGRALVTVRARDADHGSNADVVYRLSARSAAKYGSLFSVHRTTGEVRQLRPVDYETLFRDGGGGTIVLDVLAVPGSGSEGDNVGGGASPAMATVRVKVRDINDNAPKVSVESASLDSDSDNEKNDADGGRLLVMENSNNTVIAHISVDDADSGANGEVECQLKSEDGSPVTQLRLVDVDDKEFRLETSDVVDRERTPNLFIQVICRDNGQPSKKTVHRLHVDVLDQNDNSPTFYQSTYNVSVYENRPASEVLLTVKATDADAGANSEIGYRLVPSDDSRYFTIDTNSGVIQAKESLDRERQEIYQLQVVAFDIANQTGSSANRLSSTAQVVILVLDENDEQPRFQLSNYTLSVAKNQPAGTEVGRVVAVDADRTPHDQIEYLLRSQLTSPIVNETFRVDRSNGVIYTRRPIDGEETGVFDFHVEAVDVTNNRFTDVTFVRVLATDKVNTAPKLPPGASINQSVVQLASSVIPGHVVTRLKAKDATNSGNNSHLTYRMVENGGKSVSAGFFDIDSETGEIVVKDRIPELGELPALTYPIVVQVSDGGKSPSQTSIIELFVVVSKDGSHPGPAPLATLAPEAIRGRNVAASSYFPSRLEVLPAVDWRWPVVYGCLAVGGLIIMPLIIGIFVCAVRHRKRKQKRIRKIRKTSTAKTSSMTCTAGTASVGHHGLPMVDGTYRQSMVTEMGDGGRGSVAMTLNGSGDMDPEVCAAERSPTLTLRQYPDYATFVSPSSPRQVYCSSTGSDLVDRTSKLIVSVGDGRYEMCDGYLLAQFADRPNITIPRLQSTQLYGNLSPMNGPTESWLLSNTRAPTSPPSGASRLTTFSSWLTTTAPGSVPNPSSVDQISATAEQVAQYNGHGAVTCDSYGRDNNNVYVYSGSGREQLLIGTMPPSSPGSTLSMHQQQQQQLPSAAGGGTGGNSLTGTPYKRNSSTFDNIGNARMAISGSPARMAGGGCALPVQATSALFDFPVVAMTTVSSSTASAESGGVQLSPTAINNNDRGSHHQAVLGYGSPQSLERFRGRYGTTFAIPDHTNWNYQQQQQQQQQQHVSSSPKYGSLPRRAVKYGGTGGTYGSGTRTLMALDTASAVALNPAAAFSLADQLEVTA